MLPDDAPTGRERLALGLTMLLALALRVREALRAPLWYDELYSRSAVERPWHEMLRVMHADVHPPLHFVLSWLWRNVGDSDLAIRSLSIVFGMAALALAWALTRELFGRGAALLATLLLALHPWHVYISQEARSYPLLWFGLGLSALGAWRWSERGRRADALLFVLGSALALWSHYLAGVVLFAQWLWGVARFAREPKRLGHWLLLHVAVAALFAPIVPMWWGQANKASGEQWAKNPDLSVLIDTLRRLAFSATYLVPVIAAAAVAPLFDPRSRRAAGFAFSIGMFAILLCYLANLVGLRLFGAKYMMFALPSLFALVAAGLLRLPGRLGPVAGVLLVLLAARSLAYWPLYPEPHALRDARAALTGQLHEGDVVFHADTHTLLFGERYFPLARHRLLLLGQSFPYYEGSHLVADSVLADASELRADFGAGRRWWAMAARPAGLDVRPAAALFDSLAGGPRGYFGNVVRVWRAGADTVGLAPAVPPAR